MKHLLLLLLLVGLTPALAFCGIATYMPHKTVTLRGQDFPCTIVVLVDGEKRVQVGPGAGIRCDFEKLTK